MNTRTRLEANLVSESEAYGYTLSIWGAGALLVHAYGVLGVERPLAYVAGALLVFFAVGVVTTVAYDPLLLVEESAVYLGT